MTFLECVAQCGAQKGFVEQVERLQNHKFGFLHPRSPLDAAIDKATGRDEKDLALWIAIVYDLVWTRVDLRAA